MKIPVTLRSIALLILLLAALTTLAYAATVTNHYYQFYPALAKLQLGLADLSWSSDDELLSGLATFSIQNPSDYRGIGLRLFTTSLVVLLNGTAPIPQGSLPYTPPAGPLPPRHVMNVTIPFKGVLDTGQRVAKVLAQGGTVEFQFSVDLFLATFLDSTATVVEYYQCRGTIGPGECIREGAAVYGTSVGGPSPDGGA